MAEPYRIEYLPVAYNDLRSIVNKLAAVNSANALNFLDQIDSAFQSPDYFPLPGTVPKNELLYQLGYRLLVVDKYLFFCVTRPDVIEIRRILPFKREYRFLL